MTPRSRPISQSSRDEVARAIETEPARSGVATVMLDMRGIDPTRFPNVVSRLRRAGIDPVHDLVPGAGGALPHGRIATDVDARSPHVDPRLDLHHALVQPGRPPEWVVWG